MSEKPPTFLVELHAARKRCGLTQEEAGFLIGKTQSHYAKIELGLIDLSAREALILCDVFKLTIQRLLRTEE